MSDDKLIKDMFSENTNRCRWRKAFTEAREGSDGLMISTRESRQKRVILINLSEMAHELSLY